MFFVQDKTEALCTSCLCFVLCIERDGFPLVFAAPPERAGVSARVLPFRLSVCAVFFRAAGEVAAGARLAGFLFCRFPGFRNSRFTFFGNRLTSGALCAMMFSGSVSGAVLFFPRGFESRVLHNCIVPFFYGGVLKWPKRSVLKTERSFIATRGFKSLHLRHRSRV